MSVVCDLHEKGLSIMIVKVTNSQSEKMIPFEGVVLWTSGEIEDDVPSGWGGMRSRAADWSTLSVPKYPESKWGEVLVYLMGEETPGALGSSEQGMLTYGETSSESMSPRMLDIGEKLAFSGGPQVVTPEAGLTYGVVVMPDIEVPQDLRIEERHVSPRMFGEFFANRVSEIPQVRQVLADFRDQEVALVTLFDSEEDRTYDSVYEVERTTLTSFPDVRVDFRAVNLRDVGEASARYMSCSPWQTLFSRT